MDIIPIKGDVQQPRLYILFTCNLYKQFHNPLAQQYATWLNTDNYGVGEIQMAFNQLMGEPAKRDIHPGATE